VAWHALHAVIVSVNRSTFASQSSLPLPAGQHQYLGAVPGANHHHQETMRSASIAVQWLTAAMRHPQVVLSHTPMMELVPRLGPRPVLVSGLGDVMAAAASYGFTNTLHTSQLGAAMPSATPFIRHNKGAGACTCSCCSHSSPCWPAVTALHAGPQPWRARCCFSNFNPCSCAGPPSAEAAAAAEEVREQGWATERMPIEAVLVMHDPDDWYRDLQLLLDVILHGGAPLAPSSTEVVPEGARRV
jgi:hypothetical protein